MSRVHQILNENLHKTTNVEIPPHMTDLEALATVAVMTRETLWRIQSELDALAKRVSVLEDAL